MTSDPASMAFLTSQDYGMLYWFGRYCLLIFHNVWIGSLIFSLILLGTVMLLDRAFRIPLHLRGITALVPVALLFLFVQRGIQLYYKVEPSLFLLQTLALFFAALLLGVLLFRMFGVWLSMLGTHFTGRERLFCMLAYTPKATVQAAIGSLPLSAGLACGNVVLSVAVVAILLTAPLGALLIDLAQPLTAPQEQKE